MSDDEPYDADGDVSRFLHCPSPEAHLFTSSEPEGALRGLFQYAPASDQVPGQPPAPQTLDPPPEFGVQAPPTHVQQGQPAPEFGVQAPPTHVEQGQPAPGFGLQLPATEEILGHPASSQTQNAAPASIYGEAPIMDAEHHGAPTVDADHLQAPTTIYAEHLQAPVIDAEHHGAPVIDADHLQAPATIYAEHYEAPIVHAEHYEAPTVDAVQYEAPSINAEHHQVPTVNTAEHYQAPMINDQGHLVAAMDEMLGPEMQHGYGGFPDPMLVQGNGVAAEHYDVPPINAAEHQQAPMTFNTEPYQAPIINAEGHQVPAMDVDQAILMDLMLGLEMQHQGYGGFPDPTLVQGDGGVAATEHYEAPIINAAEGPQMPPAMDVEPQYQAMAMDVQPAHSMPPPGTQQAYDGGFARDPPPPSTQGDAAPWLEGDAPANGVNNEQLSLYEQLIKDGEHDLAAILKLIEDDSNGATEAAEDRHVCPAEEDVVLKPITRDQLDCARCRSVREILANFGTLKVHLMVHSAHSGTFQHAIVDRMAMGVDGQFRTAVLLFLDLRGRRDEWVQNFIEKTLEKMRRHGGQVQDTSPSTSYEAAAVGTRTSNNNNNVSAPQPSNHPHMELEVDMLSNILSGAAATVDQAANPAATQPMQQAQGNAGAAPSVPEAAISPEAAQPAVTQAQGNTTTEAPYLAEAAAVPEAASPKAAQPSVTTTQAQENVVAPSVAEAAVPEAPQPAVTQAQENAGAPSVAGAALPEAAQPPASQPEHKTDAWENFAPFNWDGFKPDHILESSLVKPYDPASGVNVLIYPSMQEQLDLSELKRKEGKKLSKMTVKDTPDYLNINDDHHANAPDFTSATFKRLCEKDRTYRLFKRRVSGLCRKIKKLEQSANRVGTGGLFAIKQKMESYKREKEELYDMIKRGMEEHERRNNGAGPSNHAAGPSSSAGPSNGAAGPSVAAGDTSNNGAGPSNAAATSKNDAGSGPSTVAATSNEDGAGPSNVTSGTSNTDAIPSNAAVPSNDAGPFGTVDTK